MQADLTLSLSFDNSTEKMADNNFREVEGLVHTVPFQTLV